MGLPEGDRGRLSVPMLMESFKLPPPLCEAAEGPTMIFLKILGLSRPLFSREEALDVALDVPLFVLK